MTVYVSITVLHIYIYIYSPHINSIDTTGGCGLNIRNVGGNAATPCGREIPAHPDEDIEIMEIAGGFDDDLRQILQDWTW